MADPLVSIIIPVYNAESYVEAAIQSAINQTWVNKEIIIVDDGSTDNSLTLAKKYEDVSIKVFSQKNKGASAARNKGLQEARGDFIQFLDADDLLRFDKIEKQINQLIDKEDYIATGGTVHFEDGNDPLMLRFDFGKLSITDPVYFLQRLYGGVLIEAGYEGMIQPNAWLIPRKIINNAGYWNEDLTLDDDGEYFCRAILASKGVIYVPDAINYYRKFKNKISVSGIGTYQALKSALVANELKYLHLKTHSNHSLTNIALAKLFTEYAVTVYPGHKDLYVAANNRLKKLTPIDYVPTIGGPGIELIKKTFGWKFAKLLQFVSRKILS